MPNTFIHNGAKNGLEYPCVSTIRHQSPTHGFMKTMGWLGGTTHNINLIGTIYQGDTILVYKSQKYTVCYAFAWIITAGVNWESPLVAL